MSVKSIEYKLCNWCNKWTGECSKVTGSKVVDPEKRTISIQVGPFPSGAEGGVKKVSEGVVKIVRKCGVFPNPDKQVYCDGYNS